MTWGSVEFMAYLLDRVFARDPEALLIDAVIISGAFFAALYVIFSSITWLTVRHAGANSSIDRRSLPKGQVIREILASVMSIAMFCVVTALTFLAIRGGELQVSGAVSWMRWAFEVALLALWNEVHFYTTHRLLHLPFLYKNVHHIHHRSVIVTPFASWRFHWIEALLLGAVMPLAMMMHTFSVWSLTMLPILSLFWNVVGHSNWRPGLLPWWENASARHAYHHRNMRFNYGFALPYLDRWLRTARNPE